MRPFRRRHNNFPVNSKCMRWPVQLYSLSPRAGSLDQIVDAPASYSSAQKISWAPVHELLHSLPMLLYHCLCFPAGILHWVIFPFHQVFKILLSPGLPPNSFIQYALHLRLLCDWKFLFPLDHWLFISSSSFILGPVGV
jgi:hypothetical protein